MKDIILEQCFFCKKIPADFNTETTISESNGFKIKVTSCWNCRKEFHEWYNKQVKRFAQARDKECKCGHDKKQHREGFCYLCECLQFVNQNNGVKEE